jgi:iron-sulfur cluster repair protein YtfE (RIC family)
MELTQDYKNIVKLRFDNHPELKSDFFVEFYKGIQEPENFDGSIFKELSLAVILGFLKKSHTEYLTLWFPKIESLAKQLQKEIGVNDLTLTLHSFLVTYSNELNNHINFEEKVLYNFVQKLLNGVYVETEKMFVLNHFLETHSHAVADDLETIKKVLLNKNPELLDNPIAKELFNQMALIHNDIEVHGIVEDEILMEKIHNYIATNF